jgi:hypothetical protein
MCCATVPRQSTAPTPDIGAVQFMANAIDASTNGIDLTSRWKLGLQELGTLTTTVAANFNKTKPDRTAPTPALLELACVLAEDAVIGAVATRKTESIRRSRLLDGFGALRLSVEALKEFRNGHAVLEQDLVEGHEVHLSVRELQLTGSLAHRVSLT